MKNFYWTPDLRYWATNCTASQGSVLLEREMFQTNVVEEIKTDILCSVTSCRKSCRLWQNVEKYCRVGWAIDDKMAHAVLHAGCLSTNTHLWYVILNAFPLQQWLHEPAPLLRCTYIACLVSLGINCELRNTVVEAPYRLDGFHLNKLAWLYLFVSPKCLTLTGVRTLFYLTVIKFDGWRVRHREHFILSQN
jgi:hypothetical protein